jgi:hypothetical protein
VVSGDDALGDDIPYPPFEHARIILRHHWETKLKAAHLVRSALDMAADADRVAQSGDEVQAALYARAAAATEQLGVIMGETQSTMYTICEVADSDIQRARASGEAVEVVELQINAIIVSAQLATERESNTAVARMNAIPDPRIG